MPPSDGTLRLGHKYAERGKYGSFELAILSQSTRAFAASGAVIFAHNHPSGVAEPSNADEMLTTSLKQALALVDVRVPDHFIVAGAGVLSFAERGLR